LALFRHGLAIVGERARNIGALHAHQKLALGDFIAQAGADIHHPPGGQRNHWHIPGDVGLHHAGDVQLRRRVAPRRRSQRKLLRMIDLDQTRVGLLLHLRRRWRFRLRIRLAAPCVAARQEKTEQSRYR
jgi:hypothetical protein